MILTGDVDLLREHQENVQKTEAIRTNSKVKTQSMANMQGGWDGSDEPNGEKDDHQTVNASETNITSMGSGFDFTQRNFI